MFAVKICDFKENIINKFILYEYLTNPFTRPMTQMKHDCYTKAYAQICNELT